jgi:hypothetical protein
VLRGNGLDSRRRELVELLTSFSRGVDARNVIPARLGIPLTTSAVTPRHARERDRALDRSAFSESEGVRQYQELIDLELPKMGAFVAAEMTPHLWAPA